ncbi:MAG: hypothetical protein ACM3KH_00170 [Thiobacillus sp.]
MYNQDMSKNTWLSIAKTFVRAVQKENKRIKQAQARVKRYTPTASVSDPINISVSISDTNDDGREYAYGMRSMPENKKYTSSIREHVNKLATFYGEHAAKYTFEGDNPTLNIVHKLFPNADAHTCPYCGVIHEFTAARARKCPDCGKQMVVRQGVFLTEDQVAKLDKEVTDYYDKAGLASELKNRIEQTQSYVSSGNYGRAFLAIAEGYQDCASIHNQRYDGGYSAWDYSWGILNREALEIAATGASNPTDLIGNGYSDVLFARGKHCLKELKYAEKQTAMNKYGKMAMEMFYSYLLALESVGLTDWQQESAIKNIHLAKILGNVKADDIKEIQARAIEHASPKPSKDVCSKVIKDVQDYVFLESDPNRLRQYIY